MLGRLSAGRDEEVLGRIVGVDVGIDDDEVGSIDGSGVDGS
jgi:hypothetical protein